MRRFLTLSRRTAPQQVATPAAAAPPSRQETIQALRRIYATLQLGQIEDAKQQLTTLGQALNRP